ncbi:hypothetical protein [Streptomyces sp. NPDC058632]|uniref:hypothetical protein n=1 Tax=Streptomyces sp. NPDC058632 TaxID=3346567 RepID=UPI003649E17D
MVVCTSDGSADGNKHGRQGTATDASGARNVKYFSFTEKGAAEYSRRAYAAYPKEGPYTMIRTTVKVADLPEGARMAYTADVIDGGVALNNSELKILGRPSIVTGLSCG